MNTEETNKYSYITRQCFINAPFEQLEEGLLGIFLGHKLQPEIGLEGECLWTRERDEFFEMSQKFAEKGLACTLHAPFFDLAPGATDSRIREDSREKLRRAFSLIEVFKPKSIVCHLGYDDNHHSYKIDEWLRISVETWSELLGIASKTDTPVMFENTYEQLPDIHLQLFEKLPGSSFGFCMDVGHLMAYAGSTWQVWLDKLQPWLGQVHLHDNDGDRDDHIAIGQGCFNFVELFDHLHRENISPLITLEPHSEKDLWNSLETIHSLNLFNNNVR
jgi:sugar phosphate isomerase/epimerase